MQSVLLSRQPAQRLSLGRRLHIWLRQLRLNDLIAQSSYERAEIERTTERIKALNGEIVKEGNRISLMKLK